jgi:hypothetical protein
MLVTIVAVAYHQGDQPKKAEMFLRKALEWGADRSAIAQILISGVFNTIGRAALLTEHVETATKFFKASIQAGSPGADERLLTPMRSAHQAMRLGVPYGPLAYGSASITCGAPERAGNSEKDSQLLASKQPMPITRQLLDIISSFANRLVAHGHNLEIDGVGVFKERDPFLPGKIAMALTYWVTEHSSDSDQTAIRCSQFKKVMQITQQGSVESWGIYFYLKALQTLHEKDLLTRCFGFEELTHLRNTLDWRSFVNEADYSLIKKPNNFYGIAYNIAFLRYQLGWENFIHCEQLLERELSHYEEASGGRGFADETNGKGRFDRYSFLLIAEIANHFYEAGLPLTARMKTWLRASTEYVMFNANERGDGFQYGRSIGAFGDSAFLEILSAAAVHGVLKDNELLPACEFARKITQKFLDFWYDENRQSINIWTDGRATESYRGKHRILGENLSLLHQHLYCQRIWESLISQAKPDKLSESLTSWIGSLPPSRLTRFQSGKCDYAVFNYRDRDRLVSLPLVNGDLHYRQMVYHQIPFITELIHAIPDLELPVLVPIFSLGNGKQCIVNPCYSDICVATVEDRTTISWKVTSTTNLDNKYPSKESYLSSEVIIEFCSGSILRKEHIQIENDSEILTFSLIVPLPGEVLNSDKEKIEFLDYRGAQCEFYFSVPMDYQLRGLADGYSLNSVEGVCSRLYEFFIPDVNQKDFELSWQLKYR